MSCPTIPIPPAPPPQTVVGEIRQETGWCGTQQTLTTFIDYLNINFQIVVKCWEEAFHEIIELPGVPPITMFTPGLRIPGVDPFRSEYIARAAHQDRAFTGHRFGFSLGGEARAPWEFKGFPAVNVPGGSYTIPGTDPMRVIMEHTRINFEIIVEKFVERGITVTIPWDGLASGSCDDPPVDDINDGFGGPGGVGPNVPDDSPDGPPIGDSQVPDFGPGSGGPGSCWDINGGEVEPDGSGGYQVVSTDNGDAIDLKCGCGAVASEDGNATAMADVGIIGNTTQGVIGATLVIEAWADQSCTTLAASNSTTANASGGACAQDFGTTPASVSLAVIAGQRVTMRVEIIIDPPFVPCASGSVTVSGVSLTVS